MSGNFKVKYMSAIKIQRQKCEVYTRVVGYLSPVHRWNRGKQQEFRDRRMFDARQIEIRG